jgi:ribosome biogenesis GTPase A
VLNKSDLADPEVTKAWIDFYNRQSGVKAVALSSKNAGEVARLPSLCQSLAPHRNDNTKPLAHDDHGHSQRRQIDFDECAGQAQDRQGRRRARGDQVAADSHQISVRHSITDTPGLMWPKIEHPKRRPDACCEPCHRP